MHAFSESRRGLNYHMLKRISLFILSTSVCKVKFFINKKNQVNSFGKNNDILPISTPFLILTVVRIDRISKQLFKKKKKKLEILKCLKSVFLIKKIKI